MRSPGLSARGEGTWTRSEARGLEGRVPQVQPDVLQQHPLDQRPCAADPLGLVELRGGVGRLSLGGGGQAGLDRGQGEVQAAPERRARDRFEREHRLLDIRPRNVEITSRVDVMSA